MTINDPIVIWGLGVVAVAIGSFIALLDRRIAANRRDIDLLKTQMASHDNNKEMLDRLYTEMRGMYDELRELAGLTNRIAGQLKVK